MPRGPKRTPYRWLFLLILAMTAVALVAGGTALYSLQSRLVSAAGEALAVTAVNVAATLDLLLDERYGDIQMLAQSSVLQGQDAAAMAALLGSLQETSPLYLWLGVTDETGRIIAATDPASVGQDRGGAAWFREAREADDIQVRDAEVGPETDGVLAVSLTAPLRGQRREFRGAVMMRVGLPFLEDAFGRSVTALQAQVGTGVRVEYQILNTQGTLIVDSRLREELKVNLKQLGLPSATLVDSGPPGYVEEEHRRRHVPVVTGYAQAHGFLPWGVLVRMDRDDLLAPISAILWKVGSVGALLFVPMLALLVWSTGRLKKEWTLAVERAAALQASEARFRSVMESVHEAVIVANDRGEVVFWNRGAESMFGHAERDMLGWPLTGIMPERYRADHQRGLERVRATGETRVVGKTVELQGLRKDGSEFPLEFSLSAWRAGDERFFGGILRDITERKVAEVEKEKLEEQLRRTDKLAALGTLLGGIAHELNNPLFMISGYAQLAAEKVRQGHYEGLDADLETIYQTTSRASAIVERSLGATRSSGERRVACQVNSLLENTLNLVANDCAIHQITIQSNFQFELPPVLADPDALSQVFLHLITNAVQHMFAAHGRGILRVTTALAPAGPGPGGSPGSAIEIRVADDGPGIPPDHLDRIFEPFFTTKAVWEGTGLGLSICHRIVSEHRGVITCESELGEGATFTVRLPAMSE